MNSKLNYGKATETERLINLNDSGQNYLTKLRFISPDISLEDIWDDLNNFASCTMLDNHELRILSEARNILKHEAKTRQTIANL